MVKQVIVVGDSVAPHGGTVITGSNADTVDGKPIARKNDLVDCKEHGKQTISEGDDTNMVSDQPVALHGHRVACGCSGESWNNFVCVVGQCRIVRIRSRSPYSVQAFDCGELS